MIRSRNCDNLTGHEFAEKIIPLHIDAGASLTGVIVAGVRVPWAGVIESAYVYAATLTDADDGVRVDLHKNGVSILTATVDPGAADTATELAGAADVAVAAGDILTAVVTTGAGDALVGDITIVLRPELGRELL